MLIRACFTTLLALAAARSARAVEFFGGLGALSPGLLSTSASSTGGKGWLAPISWTVDAKVSFDVTVAKLYLATAYTPLGRTGQEGETKTRTLLVRALGALPLDDAFELVGGLSLDWQFLSGSGDTVQLDNGDSTADFGIPSRSLTTSVAALDLGLHWRQDPWVLSTELLCEGFASSSKRNLAALFGFAYVWGGF